MRSKKSYQGAKLPEHIIEGIKQMYALEGNKAAVARAFNVNLSTVYRVLGREDPETARERRAEALGKLASKASEKAQALIDNLEPPEDATYMQKATAFGIIVDKVEKLDKRLDEKHRLDQFDAGEVLALPEDVEAVKGMIRNDLKELAVFIGLKFADLAKLPEPELAKIVEAEVTKLSDMDPGAYHGPQQSRNSEPDRTGPGSRNGDR